MPKTETPRPASKTRYEYKPPEAEMRATRENPLLSGISSVLGTSREWLNKAGDAAFLPRPQGVMGVGEALIGTAPEETREWARGNSPFSQEPNFGNRLDPRIKPGREQGLMDVGFLGADVIGLGAAGLRSGVKAAYPSLSPQVDTSRREFLGNTGKVAGGLAAASVVPDALRVVDNVAPVAPVAPRVAPHAASAAAKVITRTVSPVDSRALVRLAIERVRAKYGNQLEDPAFFDWSDAPEGAYEAYMRDKKNWDDEFNKEISSLIEKSPEFKNHYYRVGDAPDAYQRADNEQLFKILDEGGSYTDPETGATLVGEEMRKTKYRQLNGNVVEGRVATETPIFSHPAFPGFKGTIDEIDDLITKGGPIDDLGLQGPGPVYTKWLEDNYGEFFNSASPPPSKLPSYKVGGLVTKPDTISYSPTQGTNMNNSLYDAYQPSGSQSPPSYPSYAVGGMVGAGGNPVPMGQAPGAGLAPQTQQGGQIDPKMMEMQINQFANQRPQEMAQIKQAIEQALQTGELTPQELNTAVQLATVAAQNPQMYPNVRQFAIQQGIATEQDLPQQYDQGLVFVLLLAARAAQQTMGGAPAGPGMTIPSMATGGKVPQSAKPGGGVIIEAHEGEYVIPKNVVDMKGKEFFDNLVAKYAKQAGPSTSEEDD